jgi:hypothetical protein
MKMFTDCSGDCKECQISYGGGCLAGHGDDDFIRVTEKGIRRLMKNNPEYYKKDWKKWDADKKIIEIFPDMKEEIELFMRG